MSGNIADDPFAAYHEATKVMSAKKGSGSRTVSGDDVVVTGSRCATMVKTEPSSSLQGKKHKIGGVTTRSGQQSADIIRSAGRLATALSNLNLKVFPQDGTVLPIGDPLEVVQVLQGGLLRKVAEASSADALATSRKSQEVEEGIDILKAAAETFKL
ncbi:hypothetical protein F2Q69_00030106 [Brassica cretica]|uniref:Uncharacterized protein n=1 Tax=Brassica cretica TaxID=69181 RepID=A0A8S9S2Z8_BRACR|nr:hypothetical protein F2Q69_00030106 [Brassica cretica]